MVHLMLTEHQLVNLSIKELLEIQLTDTLIVRLRSDKTVDVMKMKKTLEVEDKVVKEDQWAEGPLRREEELMMMK